MKKDFKKFIILGLIVAIFSFGIFCCCFNDIAKAQEPVSSCHQTAQETESSHNGQECECDQPLAVLKESFQINDSLINIAVISLDQLFNNHIEVFTKIVAYQAPPSALDASPLYIKHSILRI